MKKILVVAVAFFAGMVLADAQYKPEGLKLSTEIHYSPGAEKEISRPDYGLKFRYDINDKWTARLHLGYEYTSELEKTFRDEDDKYTFSSEKASAGIFSIMPGIEYHFRSHGRVFPYVGAQMGYYGGRVVNKRKLMEWSSDTYKDVQPVNAFAAGVFTGVDVFLCEALYLGVELGLDYEYMKLGRSKSYRYDSGINSGYSQTNGLSSGSESSLGFNVVPAVRIGWYF